MGQEHSTKNRRRRRSTVMGAGFITGTSAKVEEKYDIDVRDKTRGRRLQTTWYRQYRTVVQRISCDLSCFQAVCPRVSSASSAHGENESAHACLFSCRSIGVGVEVHKCFPFYVLFLRKNLSLAFSSPCAGK